MVDVLDGMLFFDMLLVIFPSESYVYNLESDTYSEPGTK
jgi:hypothetical protein